MKVFNLACEHDHGFEGWFGSAEDYDSQLAAGLLECPVCANRTIRKMPAAPRLNLSGATEKPSVVAPASGRGGGFPPSGAPDARALQASFMKMARELIANTEDVGERFAEEARRIHYNESPERGIRGVASADEARELADEGIDVFAFPIPASLKEPLQ
jgi:hypothetical protein